MNRMKKTTVKPSFNFFMCFEYGMKSVIIREGE